jgi:hypothetical protein
VHGNSGNGIIPPITMDELEDLMEHGIMQKGPN